MTKPRADIRKIWLHPDSQHEGRRANTKAGVRSFGISFKVPENSFFGVARHLVPVIDLRKAGNAKVSARTRVFVGVKSPTDESVTFLPGAFDLSVFTALDTTEQRKSENRDPRTGTLSKDLGRAVALQELDELVFEFEGPDIIDWAQVKTVFEFEVSYGRLR